VFDKDEKSVATRLEEHDISLEDNSNNIDGRGINIMYPPPPFVGAKGDGITDDTITIQNVINLIKPTGGKVFVPVGRFLVSGIVLPSYTTLEGEGVKSEIFTSTDKRTIIITETNAEKVIVRNLKVYGNGTGTQPLNTIDNPNVTDAGCGIVFIGVNNGLVENCFVDNCGGNGLNGNNGIAGIYLTYGCHDCIVDKNVVTNCRNGINEDNFFCQATKDAQNNIISKNYVDGCRFGIATDCYTSAKGLQIIDNVIRNCMYTAIDVNKTSYVKVKGNWIENNGNTTTGAFSSSVMVYGTTDGAVAPNFVSIEDNWIINSFSHGVKITNNSYYVTLDNNHIIGCQNGGQGILIQASRYWKVIGGEIMNCSGSGIYANPLTLNGVSVGIDKGTIIGTIIKGNQNHGIYAEGLQHAKINGNHIDGNGLATSNTYSGITLTSGSTQNTIDGNDISGSNQKYGIGLLDSNSILNTIGVNTLSGNIQDIGMANEKQYFQGNQLSGANRFTMRSSGGHIFKVTISDTGVLSQTELF
jgi:hypothetical protein